MQIVYLITREGQPAKIFATIDGALAHVLGSAAMVTFDLMRPHREGTHITREIARGELDLYGSIHGTAGLHRFTIFAKPLDP
jgi:hypothetical protein